MKWQLPYFTKVDGERTYFLVFPDYAKEVEYFVNNYETYGYIDVVIDPDISEWKIPDGLEEVTETMMEFMFAENALHIETHKLQNGNVYDKRKERVNTNLKRSY